MRSGHFCDVTVIHITPKDFSWSLSSTLWSKVSDTNEPGFEKVQALQCNETGLNVDSNPGV